MSETIDRQTSPLSPTDLALYKAGIRLRHVRMIYPDAADGIKPVNAVNWLLNQAHVAANALTVGGGTASHLDRAREGILRAEEWWNRLVSGDDYSGPGSFLLELETVSDSLLAWARSLGPDEPAAAAWFELGTRIIDVSYDGGQPARRAPIDQLLTQTGHTLAELLPEDIDDDATPRLPEFLADDSDYADWAVVEAGLNSLPSLTVARAVPARRLRIDDDTRKVVLDEVEYIINHPRSFLFFKGIAEASPAIFTTAELNKLPGCKGCTGKVLKRNLPKPLEEVIGSKSGKGGGYFLQLPEKKDSVARETGSSCL